MKPNSFLTMHRITGAIRALSGVLTLTLSGTAFAQEQGRVISTTPVISQVAVPRQVCTNEQIVTQSQQKSGAGALMGGVAGGALGNAVGDGSGRAVATMIGILGGAILGDKIEGGGQQHANTQNVQRCTTQTFYENKATAYNVVYEFNGKQYQVQMPQDPGAFVNLQVTPVGSQVQPAAPVIVRPVTQAPVYTQPVYSQPVYSQPVIVESSTVYVQPAPVYVHRAPVIVHAAPNYAAYPRPHAHSHLHPSLQPQHLAYFPAQPHVQHAPHHGRPHHPHAPRHGSTVSIGYSRHLR